jgi:hypothetical protein
LLVATPPAGGVTELGEKPHVIPAGRPVQDRDTAAEKPLNDITVATLVAFPAMGRISELGELLTLKSGPNVKSAIHVPQFPPFDCASGLAHDPYTHTRDSSGSSGAAPK